MLFNNNIYIIFIKSILIMVHIIKANINNLNFLNYLYKIKYKLKFMIYFIIFISPIWLFCFK